MLTIGARRLTQGRAPAAVLDVVTEFAAVLEEAMAGQPTTCTSTAFEQSLRSFERSLAGVVRALDDANGGAGTGWAAERPRWAAELGVDLPCSADDVRRAFRRRAFETHPDRSGGSHEAFLRVQALVGEALAWLRAELGGPRFSAMRYRASGPARVEGTRLRSTYA